MTDRPLLMSAPMVLGALKGWKTNTRRVLPDAPHSQERSNLGVWHCDKDEEHGFVFVPDAGLPRLPARVKYQVGDRIYVREAWRTTEAYQDLAPRDMSADEPIRYEADHHVEMWGWERLDSKWGKFRQGMHMPRWASRLTLMVTNVRVQRIKDISAEDAIAEGIYREKNHNVGMIYKSKHPTSGGSVESHNPVKVFSTLWDDLNQSRGFGWDANPWVCAISFSVIHKNIDQMGETA